MINLLESNIDIEIAKEEHYSFFKCYVNKRLRGVNNSIYKTHFPNRNNGSKSNHFDQLVNFVTDECLEKILIGKPNELKTKHNELKELINRIYGVNSFENYIATKKNRRYTLGDIHSFIKDIHAVFNYDWFISLEPYDEYSAYKLTNNLAVRSCVFCNRTYTISRTSKSKGKLMRPQLDHWYPQSKHPLLSVSFYNLIPCCTYCNSSVKGALELNLETEIHPYVIENIKDDFSFGYYFEKSIDEYVIYLKRSSTSSGKIVKTLKKLKIDQMYNAHIPELVDLIKLKKAYGLKYIDSMASFFPNTGLTERETFRILLGVENESKNHHLLPMSKFKTDILKDLGIIKKMNNDDS